MDPRLFRSAALRRIKLHSEKAGNEVETLREVKIECPDVWILVVAIYLEFDFWALEFSFPMGPLKSSPENPP